MVAMVWPLALHREGSLSRGIKDQDSKQVKEDLDQAPISLLVVHLGLLWLVCVLPDQDQQEAQVRAVQSAGEMLHPDQAATPRWTASGKIGAEVSPLVESFKIADLEVQLILQVQAHTRSVIT